MRFADDPVGFFGDDGFAASALGAEERERLQQEALAYRLSALLPAIPPLAALAGAQGLDAGIALDEAPRLFFPNSIYKSYDPAWLTGHDFPQMTAWLDKFTTHDLSLPAGSDFPTIDAWLDWIEGNHALEVIHSSGTTSKLSLLIRHAGEIAYNHHVIRMLHREWFARAGLEMGDMRFHVIWLAPAEGRGAMTRAGRPWREISAPSPDAFAALFERDLGTDYELYALQARAAAAQGELSLPQPSAHVEGKLAEAEQRMAGLEDHFTALLDRIAERMRGRRAIAIGGPHNLARLAHMGIARGMDGMLGVRSLYASLGGLKGRGAPEGLERDLQRFIGSRIALDTYGMTELRSGFMLCRAGRFHVPPWIVAWALDPADGWKPFPRTGVREGRAAFLDLALCDA